MTDPTRVLVRPRPAIPPAFRAPPRRSRGALGLLLVLITLLAACKKNVLSSKTEDDARLVIPVPICLKRLPRATTPGAVVSLTSEEYWSLLLPSYDVGARTVDPRALDCSGRQSLARLSPPETIAASPGSQTAMMVRVRTASPASTPATIEKKDEG